MARRIITYTAYQRRKNLTALIKDAIDMEFNPNLIKFYKNQLSEVEKEIIEEKEAKQQFKLNMAKIEVYN